MTGPRDHSLTSALLADLACEVDVATRHRAALHLLDWLACARAACAEPARRAMTNLYDYPADGGLALFGLQRPIEHHLMLDGALGSMLEMDDVHRAAVLHPGPVIMPAVLLAARQQDATPSDLLDAIVFGYEVMIRIGRGMGPSHYAHWHPTATIGPFGAAAAVGKLLDLSAEQMVWALGNAGTRTGGLWQLRHEPVPSKALHTALAARDGWLAAMLAKRGFAGPSQILEGPQGLLAAAASDADPDRMLGPSDHWLIHEVSFKPWPACRHAHPAIDALMALQTIPPPEAIERIEIGTYQAAIDFCDKATPTTPAEARFSIQHALAAAILHGRPCLAQYQPACIADAEVSALRARIQLHCLPAFNQAFPAHFGAELRLVLRTGQTEQTRIDDAWGDPENPLERKDLEQKCEDLFGHAGLGQTAIRRVIDQTLHLADAESLDTWWQTMAECAA